jgi:hypothetical protein
VGRKSDAELPELNRIIKDQDPAAVLAHAAKIIKFDLKTLSQSKRALKKGLQERDILLYFLKETGFYTNKQIGDLFNLTYSAVSRRSAIVKSDILRHAGLKRKYDLIKSRITV